jgi:hypothetical protein
MFEEIVAKVSTPVSKVIVSVVVTGYKLSATSQNLLNFFILYIINVLSLLVRWQQCWGDSLDSDSQWFYGFIERENLDGKSINHDSSASFGTVLRECMFSMGREIKYGLSRREKMMKNQPIIAVPYLLVPYQRKEKKKSK